MVIYDALFVAPIAGILVAVGAVVVATTSMPTMALGLLPASLLMKIARSSPPSKIAAFWEYLNAVLIQAAIHLCFCLTIYNHVF